MRLISKLYGHPQYVSVDENLAYLAGAAYGDGYAEYGEIRVVTAEEQYKETLEHLVSSIAERFGATFRTYERVSTISGKPLWDITLTSTVLRRALFTDRMSVDYDAMRVIAFNNYLAPHFQAGLTDSEGTLMPAQAVEYPHGRVFAIENTDKRLLGIARVSLTRCVRIEPSSVRIRQHSPRGRSHFSGGHSIVNRRISWVLEILSSGKRKWLQTVGVRLRHPRKSMLSKKLLETFT